MSARRYVRAVSPPSDGSIAFHRAMGFVPLGGDRAAGDSPMSQEVAGPGISTVVFVRRIVHDAPAFEPSQAAEAAVTALDAEVLCDVDPEVATRRRRARPGPRTGLGSAHDRARSRLRKATIVRYGQREDLCARPRLPRGRLRDGALGPQPDLGLTRLRARLVLTENPGAPPEREATWVPVDDLLARLAPTQSKCRLSSVEVLELGEPALFDDFGERLLYADGRLIDLLAARRSPAGELLAPLLPASIIESGVGLEFGWRHAAACGCVACSGEAAA